MGNFNFEKDAGVSNLVKGFAKKTFKGKTKGRMFPSASKKSNRFRSKLPEGKQGYNKPLETPNKTHGYAPFPQINNSETDIVAHNRRVNNFMKPTPPNNGIAAKPKVGPTIPHANKGGVNAAPVRPTSAVTFNTIEPTTNTPNISADRIRYDNIQPKVEPTGNTAATPKSPKPNTAAPSANNTEMYKTKFDTNGNTIKQEASGNVAAAPKGNKATPPQGTPNVQQEASGNVAAAPKSPEPNTAEPNTAEPKPPQDELKAKQEEYVNLLKQKQREADLAAINKKIEDVNTNGLPQDKQKKKNGILGRLGGAAALVGGGGLAATIGLSAAANHAPDYNNEYYQ